MDLAKILGTLLIAHSRSMQIPSPFVSPILVLAAFAPLAVAQEDAKKSNPPSDFKSLPAHRQIGFDSINTAHCRSWLTYLAADELRGRATGTPGYKLAAEFVAERFKEAGLKPVGDDGTYFQKIPCVTVGPDPDVSYIAVLDSEGNEIMRVAVGKGVGGAITEKSDAVYELTMLAAKSADDVEGADVKGKAVLFLDESPPGRRGTVASRALMRAQPGSILAVNDVLCNVVESRVSLGSRSRNRASAGRFRRPNSYSISSQVAEKLKVALQAAGTLRLKTNIVVIERPAFAANVVGLLEGSDPALKNEIVGIGSHLDHIGARGERINNGADDDGSGTTGVIAVSRAFAKNPVKPRRSVLFMCFAGEERGMIGSGYYADNPIFPNQEMVVELQMDMIGRNEEFVNRRTGEVTEKASDNVNTLHLIGSQKLSEAVHNVCLAMNQDHVGFEFEYDEEDVFYRSDHVKFAQKDIPVAFFFTGFHPQYHQPDDTVDRINFPKLARVAKLVYAIAFEIGDAEERPKRDRLWSEVPRRSRRR